MVVVTAAAALGAKVFAALSITGAFATGVTFATVALGFLTQAALGFALNALSPKPKIRGANRGYQVNARGSALDHQIIYGEARIGGVVIFEESVEGQTDNPDVDNQFLLRVYAHAGHEIEGYQDVYIDGKKVTEWRRADTDAVVSGPSAVSNGTPLIPYTVCDVRSNGTVIPEAEDESSCNNRYAFGSGGGRANNMVLRFYDGSQTVADGSLIADSNVWNSDCVLNETAYMTALFGADFEFSYPNGVPEITCTIKGKKCFDPRTGTTAYSQNPAICIRDYLTSGYGLSEDDANIDDTLVATAADVCDEIVEAGINRYTCKGAFVTSVEPADILADLLTSMGGLLWYSQGKWRMKPAYWTAPSLTLTEDDLRSNIAVKTRHSRRDNFNIVKGTFRGPETNWQVTDYPEVPKAGDPNPFLEVDGGQESVIDLDLPFTDNSFIARRIARIFLERNRQQLTISATFGMRAFGLQIGDNVRLSLERFGWVEKTFEVNSWTFGLADDKTLQVQMTLREISEEVFNDVDDGALFEIDNTTLYDPFLTAAPTNLTATDGGFIGTDGTFVNSISVSWDVVKPTLVRDYVLEWKKSSATNYNSVELKTQNYDIPGVEDGVEYNIRVKSINTIGVSSEYASITFTPGQDTTTPNAPTSLSAVGGLRRISLQWQAPTTNTDSSILTDLSGYKVYRSLDSTFGNSVLAGTIDGTTFSDEGLSDTTLYYYWVIAVDTSGNESSAVGPASAQTEFISAADMVDDIREEIGAARVDVVSSLPSSGYSAGDFVYLTTDGKLYEYNGTSWAAVVGDVPSGSITETEISDNSISTPKLQANSITTAKIDAGAITSDELAANSVIAGKISAGAVSADKIAVDNLAAIKANLGEITAGSIDTVTGGVGIRVNTSLRPRAFYSYQSSTSTYALFASNQALGGGASQIVSFGGFSLQVLNNTNGSGAFGAYVAIDAQHTTGGGGHGQVGVSSAGGGYGFKAISGGYYDSSGAGYNPFTGRHDAMILKTATYELGDIVCDKSVIVRDLSDSFTEVELSSSASQAGVVGVMAKVYDSWYTPASFIDKEATRANQEAHESTPNEPAGEIVTTHNVSDYEDDYDLVTVNAVGEGAVNVCGEGGDIQTGDLIVASSIAGKGMKQSDDIVRSYTVAKARESMAFSSATEVKQIACIYMCG